jgi:hypothetical protein
MQGREVRKICRTRHQLPIGGDVPESRKPSYHWLFCHGTVLAHQYQGCFQSLPIRSSAMLPAIGAASAALDAIQSLTSPQPGSSSQSTDFFGSFSDAGDSSAASSAQSTVSGFSSAQISSDNLNALFDAQSLTSGDAAGALDSGSSTSDSSTSDSSSASASGTASSAYSAINQLTQSTAIPLAFSPFSVSA